MELTGRLTYDNRIKHFNAWAATRNIDSIDHSVIESYFADLAKTYKPSTINSARSAIKYSLRQAGRMDVDSLFRTIRIYGANQKCKTDYLYTEPEIRKLIDNTPPRLSLMIKFLYSTGCRISSVLDIRLSDCRTNNNNMVDIDISSKNHEYTVKISADLFEQIKSVFHSTDYLFESPRSGRAGHYSRRSWHSIIQRYGQAVLGRSNLSPHKFKHSMISNLLKKGRTYNEIASRTGNTTDVIARFYDCNTMSDNDILSLENIA